MPKALFVGAVVAGAVLIPMGAAWAPSPIAQAVEAQQKIGFRPCAPLVSTLPLELEVEGVVGDADNGVQSGRCEIRLASGANLPDEILLSVAWHEVCHLSTVEPIAQRADKEAFGEDWAHAHPLFKACLAHGPADTGGY